MASSISAEYILQLVEQAKRGNRASFSELYSLYFPLVRRVLSRACSNRYDVEDLTQDTFLQILTKITTLREANNFQAWLLSIAHNKLKNYYRRKQNQPAQGIIAERTISNSVDILTQILIADEKQQVDRAMQLLKSTDSTTLKDYYWRGLSIQAIAHEQNAPLGTIKRRLCIARQRIARYLR